MDFLNWNVIFTTYIAIFVAELGDKTQLATLNCAIVTKSPVSIFIGSSLALITASVIAVVIGCYVSKWIPIHYVSKIAGVIFIGLGIFYIFKS